jgi:hypothetical protein
MTKKGGFYPNVLFLSLCKCKPKIRWKRREGSRGKRVLRLEDWQRNLTLVVIMLGGEAVLQSLGGHNSSNNTFPIPPSLSPMTNCITNILPFYFLPFSLINYLLHLHLHWSSVAVDGQQHNGHHRPNVLFLLADDLGFADLDWHDPSLHTPNLRRLAFSAHSVRLSNVYVGPLCTPLVISFIFLSHLLF